MLGCQIQLEQHSPGGIYIPIGQMWSKALWNWWEWEVQAWRGAWTNGSSLSFKDNITQLDGVDILKKISLLEVSKWKYKETEEYHIGPFAEQFYELFNTGVDKKYISTIDPAGVALAGIKQLIKRDEVRDSIIKEQNSQIENCCFKNQSNVNSTQQNNDSASIDVDLKDGQSVVLDQNVPNPFAEQTTINYFLPDNVSRAQMLFYNAQGKLIQSVDLNQKGKGSLNVFAQDLSNGVYTYTLVVDGKIFETKKMVKQQ